MPTQYVWCVNCFVTTDSVKIINTMTCNNSSYNFNTHIIQWLLETQQMIQGDNFSYVYPNFYVFIWNTIKGGAIKSQKKVQNSYILQ